jgi:hypothetical protein
MTRTVYGHDAIRYVDWAIDHSVKGAVILGPKGTMTTGEAEEFLLTGDPYAIRAEVPAVHDHEAWKVRAP